GHGPQLHLHIDLWILTYLESDTCLNEVLEALGHDFHFVRPHRQVGQGETSLRVCYGCANQSALNVSCLDLRADDGCARWIGDITVYSSAVYRLSDNECCHERDKRKYNQDLAKLLNSHD